MLEKIKKIVLYTLLVYGFFGFIILPFVLKPQVIEIIQKETNSKIAIDKISLNPFLFKLKLSGVELSSLDDKPLVSFDSLLVDVELYSLLISAIHINELTLSQPKIHVVYNNDRTINLLTILKEKEKEKTVEPSEPSAVPRIIIDSLKLVDGYVSYEDYTLKSKFDFSFGDIGFELKDIDTNDFNTSSAELRFYSHLGDGGFVDFKSKIEGFKPFVVKGSLDFEASKLYSQWKYMQDSLNLEVADGKISFHTEYHLNLDDLNSTTINNLNVSLDKLRVKPKSKYKDVLNLGSLYVQNATIKPMIRSVHVTKIGLDSLNIKAKRDENGEIDWLEYIKVEANDEVSEAKEIQPESNTTSPAWDVLVDDISLENIALNFQDTAVKPAVESKLNEFNLYAQNITLAGEKPFTYQLNILLNDVAKCSSKGNVIHSILDVQTYSECDGFNIAHYRPYIDQAANAELELFDLKLQNAVTGFKAKVEVKDIQEEIVINVSDANLSLTDMELRKRSTKEKLVNFSSLGVDGVKVSTLEKTVDIQKVSLNGLDIKTARLEDGTLNVQDLVVPKTKKRVKKVTKKSDSTSEKEYSVKLKHFALDAAQVGFNDKALNPHVKSKIDRIFLNAYDIDVKKNSWLKYRLYMRVNSKGIITSNGNLRHTPLKQKGSFEVKNLSLTELTPYLQEKAFVKVDDGRLSLKTKTEYSVSSKKPDLKVDGSFSLNEFFVSDSRDDSSVASLSELVLKSFTFELSPNRLYIDEIDVNAFYVNALIDEKKQMNLAQLVKPSDENVTVQEEETPVEAEDENTTQEVVFPVKILKMNVALGSANFADLSLPVQFKTNIHDLNGAIYSISNVPGETTYVNIDGEIDKYGSTKLKGSVNSANPKEYTDLEFNFKNLDLHSLSGYSANFAGHEIDSGKLFLELGYDIKNSELLGSNSVMIKQIMLGREVEDENITSLPLGFVIGLLEDNEGIIEIDMPVEGNLDEPDFKYGTLILKTIGNLILKAVTSPFSFLGSMMGIDGEALKFVEFETGSAVVLPTEREKLDQIVKMMTKRPKISLAFTPTYDELSDKRALQAQMLIDLVVKESGIKNRDEYESVMNVDLLEDIYEDVKDDDVLDKLEDRLEKEYKGEEFDRAYSTALLELCKDIQVVTKADLENLAKKRADAVVTYLVQDKNVEASRVIQNPQVMVNTPDDELVKQVLSVEVK